MKTACAAMLALAGLLLFTVSAPGQAAAQSGDDPGQVTAGQAVFEMNCAGCHASDGTGVAGRGRPLIGIAAQGDRATHVASITNGKGGMPAFDERLTSEEIEQAASYVRLTFVEPAAESSAPTELAVTGIESSHVAVVGLAMLAGGLQLVVWSRQRSDA